MKKIQAEMRRRVRHGAKRRGLECRLTDEEMLCLMQKPCNYCGALPCNRGRLRGRGEVWLYNGIDRVCNDTGYTAENSVPCCWICNRAKRDMPLDAFLAWVKRVACFSRRQGR